MGIESPEKSPEKKPPTFKERLLKLKDSIQKKGKELKPALDEAGKGAKKIGKDVKETAGKTWEKAKPVVDKATKSAKEKGSELFEKGKAWLNKKDAQPEKKKK